MKDREMLQRFAQFLEDEQRKQPQHVDVPTAINEYASWLRASGKAEGTVKAYLKDLRRLSKSLDILRLTPFSVIDFSAKASQRYSARSLAKFYSGLRSWAEFTGQKHAVETLKAPRIDSAPVPLPPADDVRAIRDAMRPSKHEHNEESNRRRRDGAMFDLLFEGALRLSEALALDLEDLKHKDAEGGVGVWRPGANELTHVLIRKSKRNKSRMVPLTPLARKSLSAFVALHRSAVADCPAVFQTRHGRLTESAYRSRLVMYGEEVGVKSLQSKTHHGRRSKITRLIENRASPSAIIRITGHKSVAELEPYIQLADRSSDREWLEKS